MQNLTVKINEAPTKFFRGLKGFKMFLKKSFNRPSIKIKNLQKLRLK